MSFERAVAMLFPLVIVLPLACGNSDAPSGSGATSAMTTSAPAATPAVTTAAAASGAPGGGQGRGGDRRGGDRRWGGSAMLFRMARDLDLKDAQKTVLDKLEQDLKGQDEGPGAEQKDLHTELITQIKAGKIDTAKLGTLYDAIDKAVQARRDKEAEALNSLHAALDPAQRKALTAAVRTKQAEREARGGGEHGGDGKDGKDAKGSDADWQKHHLEHLTKELDLDPAQQKKVEALLAKSERPGAGAKDAVKEQMKKSMDALLTAFEADTFDAKKLELWPAGGKKAHEGMEAEVKLLGQLLPILKPEQRAQLASSMEKRFSHMTGRPGGHGGSSGYGPLFDDPAHENEK